MKIWARHAILVLITHGQTHHLITNVDGEELAL